MYYKKRPELMKFVEDFYRAYRALAERYNHATGALSHAHRTIAEAFPNHISLALSEESPSISPGTEAWPCTPEIPSPLHPLFEPDDLHKDALSGTGYFHTVNRNAAYAEDASFATKKGLKQLNEMFSPREGIPRVNLHEGKVRKGLNFQEEEESFSRSKTPADPKILSEQEVKEKENGRIEIIHLQEEVSQLSIENKKLKIQLELESTNSDLSRTEVQSLKFAITKLESEKQAIFSQYQLLREKISSTDNEIIRAKYEFGKLHEEVIMGIVKLCSAEEECLSLKMANQSLILELEQDKNVLEEIRSISVEKQNHLDQEVKEKEDAKNEMKQFHKQLTLVSNENHSLKIHLKNETDHLHFFRAEVQNMRDAISKLESGKEAALLQNQLLRKNISSLEMENFQAKDEIGKLHEEILMGIFKLCSAEEHYIALDEANHGLKLELEERKRVLEEIRMLSVESQTFLEQEVKEKVNIKNEMESLQGEISQLSIENQNLKSQMVSISKHLGAYSTEIQNLRDVVSILECEKIDAVSENQLFQQSITNLEGEISRAKEEIRELHAEVLTSIVKLCSAGEKHLELEDANDNLKSEIEKCKERLDDLKNALNESDKQRGEAESSLQSWERLYNLSQEKVEHMTFEIRTHLNELKDIEHDKLSLEEEMCKLKEVNFNLNECILAYNSKLTHLQDEIVSLNENNHKLEDEISIHLGENKVLQQELDCFKEDRNELDIKHKSLIEQLEVASLNMESLEILVKELQFGCAELSEGCRKLEDEKLLLLNKLQDMESICERNVVFKNSLSEATEKIRVLEDFCESLNTKSSTHVVEKAALATQIEVITGNMEKLSEKNILLENSLADVNTELEGLRLKVEVLEESSQFLSAEYSNLLVQKNALVSQVESIHCDLTDLETKHAILEVDYLNLEKEKGVSVVQVTELKAALKINKKEHDSHMQTSNISLLSLKNQIHLLQEDRRFKDKELEMVQQKCTSYIIEILVLQVCLSDLKNSFRIENKKQELLIQSGETQLKALESQINLLQEKGHARDEEFEKELQKHMDSILGNFLLQRCLSEVKEKYFILSQECQQHIKSSRCAGELISHLEGSKLILKEKNNILVEHNSRLMDGIVLLLESLDINKKLINTDESEDALIHAIKGEITNLLACISDLNDENQFLNNQLSVYHTFLEQISLEKVFLGQELGRMGGQLLVFKNDQDQLFERCERLGQDVNDKDKLLKDLSKDFSHLREENDVIIEEAMALEHLYLFYMSSNSESLQSLKALGDGICSLVAIKNDREKQIIENNERINVAENERKWLKESITLLEELRSRTTVLEFDLFTARLFSEDLIYQIEIGENLLTKKSTELLKAYNKLQGTHEELTVLCTKLDAANKEVDEAKMMRVQFEGKVAVLLEGHAYKDVEIVNTHEENRMLNEEINKLNGKVEVLRKIEHNLSYELQNNIGELDRCEGEIMNLFNEIQVSTVNGAVFEDKMLEWVVAFEVLEICSLVQREMLTEGISLTNAHAFELKEKLDDLEKENRELKSIWSSCLPLFISLDNGIATAEKQAHQLANLHEVQDIPLTNPQEENASETGKGNLTTAAGILELQNLISKVEALVKLLTDAGNQLKHERLLYASNLEASRREKEGLSMEISEQDEKQGNETSKAKNGQLVKDIELDQVSNSNVLSRIQSAESEDQMLRLWETAEKDCSNSVSNLHGIESEEFNIGLPSSELTTEKELGVDKLEMSTKGSQEDWNRMVIERLSTDAEKLSALKTTVKELEEKIERSSKNKRGKSSELDAIHAKLKLAEKGILELVDTEEKLRKKVEDHSKSSHGEKMRLLDRRHVFEQARIALDRIEKLEMELQEIYFIFVKLEEEAERSKTRERDRSPRVLLRDYISGWRVGKARKKGAFCGCMRPEIEE